MNALGPQFLYHGTAMEVEGDKILPAVVHGKGSYWKDAGREARGEAAQDHAWAHPSEKQAWDFAHDRVVHTEYITGGEWNPRARVYKVHTNDQQSAGHDLSIPGEVKAPHFDIAERVDTMPGRQGTFPEINWNNHVMHTGAFAHNEDANHPSNLSVQFGHRNARWGDHWNGDMVRAAKEESDNRYIDRLDALGARGYNRPKYSTEDTPIPSNGKKMLR